MSKELYTLREQLYTEVEQFKALKLYSESYGILKRSNVAEQFSFERTMRILTSLDDISLEMNHLKHKLNILRIDHRDLKNYCNENIHRKCLESWNNMPRKIFKKARKVRFQC